MVADRVPSCGASEQFRRWTRRRAYDLSNSGKQCAAIYTPAIVPRHCGTCFCRPLRAVVSLCPVRVGNRFLGPLMEGLPQELRTTPSPMDPMLLATGLGYRGNLTVLLDLGGVLIAVALCSKGS